MRALSSVGERFLDAEEVGSSILPAPTNQKPLQHGGDRCGARAFRYRRLFAAVVRDSVRFAPIAGSCGHPADTRCGAGDQSHVGTSGTNAIWSASRDHRVRDLWSGQRGLTGGQEVAGSNPASPHETTRRRTDGAQGWPASCVQSGYLSIQRT